MTPKFRTPFQPTDLDRPTRDDGGPAFPISDPILASGMTLRDYFAGQALTGAMERFFGPDRDAWDGYEDMAGTLYRMADALLKERAKP